MRIQAEKFFENQFAEELKKLTKRKGTREIKKGFKFLENFKKIPSQFKKEIKFSKNAKKNEKLYISFLINFLSDLDKNTADIGIGLKTLLDKKDYKSSMFLLRGFIESSLFNIFITLKLKKYLEATDYSGFIKLVFRANFSSDKPSFKTSQLKNESAIIKKIIENKNKGRRIHINDCIEYYKKTDFKQFLNGSDMAKEIINSVKGMSNFKEIYKKWDNDFLIYVYDKLCEIIHPTAIALHKGGDKTTTLDFKAILMLTIETDLNFLNWMCISYKQDIIKTISYNNEIYIKKFRDYLN